MELPQTPDSKHNHSPMVSTWWKYSVVLGNFMLAGLEVYAGGANNPGVLADSVHNAGDGATYHIQADNVIGNRTSTQEIQRRKLTHGVLMGGSAGVAGLAAYELAFGAEHQASKLQVGVAAASVLFNSLVAVKPLLAARRRKQTSQKFTRPEADVIKHIFLVDMPSSALALGGSVLSRYSPGLPAEDIAGLVSGSIGAYAFRPTKNNLGHVHH